MTSIDLNNLIDRLKDTMPSDPGAFGIGVHRQDWRSFWALAKEIQEAFNSNVRYPTKEERQKAWDRFNLLRDEASRRAKLENMHIGAKSSHHKEAIFDQCRGIGWLPIEDVIFFFDPTTVEDMKRRGRYLGQAMKYFSEHKLEMLGEDKKACHERIQEIKEQQDRFWEKYKIASRGQRAERCRANLAKNRENYRKASNALERFREKTVELRDKISSSTSSKWIEIWTGWISETESKIDDIEGQLRRLDEWIEEDEMRLRELGD